MHIADQLQVHVTAHGLGPDDLLFTPTLCSPHSPERGGSAAAPSSRRHIRRSWFPLEVGPVSTDVNKVGNDRPDLIDPIDEHAERPLHLAMA